MTTPPVITMRSLALLLMVTLAAPAWGQQTGPRNCFWQTQGDPAVLNVAYPDFAARYWLSVFALPAGAHLELKGEYPHARYMSFNVYDAGAAPVDGLADVLIAPDPGSVNPFHIGARRDATARNYTVRVNAEPAPAAREPNTLYQTLDGTVSPAPLTGSETGSPIGIMLYRIYLPDDGRDLTGDVPLPAIAVVMPGGLRIEGPAACDVLSAALPDPLTPALYDTTPPTAPRTTRNVTDPVTWYKFTSIVESVGVTKPEPLAPFLPNNGGFLSNIDNAYVRAAWDTSLGEGVMLFGKAPTIPRTRKAPTIMPGGQMRYWSICQNDSTTTRAVSCAADEDVPLGADGDYVVYISGAGTRPANATTECGVAYLPAGPNVRGFLLLRHMLPRPDFVQSIQAVTDINAPGTSMGPYLPIGKHLTRAQFETLGCPVTSAAVAALLGSAGIEVPGGDSTPESAPESRGLGVLSGSIDWRLLILLIVGARVGARQRSSAAR